MMMTMTLTVMMTVQKVVKMAMALKVTTMMMMSRREAGGWCMGQEQLLERAAPHAQGARLLGCWALRVSYGITRTPLQCRGFGGVSCTGGAHRSVITSEVMLTAV